MSTSSFAARLAAGPIVLDGGLATELEAKGHDLSSSLWSARVLQQEPQTVVRAHRAYFDAGAQVATTASYQVSVDGFAAVGVDRAGTDRLLRRSVELARRAVDESGGGARWVAASVGPYGASLADGSEYGGDYGRSVAELRAWHRPRLEVLAAAGPDVLALETIPCLAEVEALLAEVAGLGVACWLSLTCDGVRTRAGEPAVEAFAMAADVSEVVAVGVNCLDPAHAAALVGPAALASGKPAVVYPNAGETWDADARSWVGPAATELDADRWLADGARLVGGCCRVGPTGVANVAAQVATFRTTTPPARTAV